MGAMQRRKGAQAERDVCALIRDLLGVDARRRVRQHEADSDVLGLPGFAIEVKNQRALCIPAWWRQTVEQAGNDVPILIYRWCGKWRVRWPIALAMGVPAPYQWTGLQWTADTTAEAWAAVMREHMGGSHGADRDEAGALVVHGRGVGGHGADADTGARAVGGAGAAGCGG